MMKIKKTIEYMKALYDTDEAGVLKRFGFEDFSGCENLDKLFKIESKDGKTWEIQRAQHPRWYVSVDTYSLIDDPYWEVEGDEKRPTEEKVLAWLDSATHDWAQEKENSFSWADKEALEKRIAEGNYTIEWVDEHECLIFRSGDFEEDFDYEE